MNAVWIILTVTFDPFRMTSWQCSPTSHEVPVEGMLAIPGVAVETVPAHVPVVLRQHGDSHAIFLTSPVVRFVNITLGGVTVDVDLRAACGSGVHVMHARAAGPLPASILKRPELVWIQRVGTAPLTKTITFLSSGYSASERLSFISDVRRSCAILQLNAPWSRYYSLMNFAALFDAAAPDGSNSLDCKFGNPQRKMLACAPEKVLRLAKEAPYTDVYVVLVKAEEYGGTGNRGLCVLSTKHSHLELLLLHELAHSDAGVSDEYTYGYSEPRDIRLTNCWSGKNETPWAGWIANGVLRQPVKGCSYDNYFRPTSDECVMGNPNTRNYCPVCREALVKTFYSRQRNLAAPMCPEEGELVHVMVNGSVVLHAGRALVGQANIKIEWSLIPGGTVQNGLTSITVTGAALGIGIHSVNVTITDTTAWVLASNRNEFMTYRTQFNLNVSDSHSQCDNMTLWKSCGVRETVSTPYCSTCPSGLCNKTESVTTRLDATANIGQFVDDVKTYMLGIGGGATLGGVVLIIAMWGWSVKHAKNNVQEVLPIPANVESIVTTTLAISVVIMLFSAVAFVALLYFYTTSELYGQALCIVALPIPGILWFISFICFFAVWWKAPAGLGIVGTLYLMSALTCFAVGVSLLYFMENTKSQKIVNVLHKNWDENVAKRPEWVCTMQGTLRCSGFLHPCHEALNSTSCPLNCDVGNTFTDACYAVLTDRLHDQLSRPSIVILLFGAVILLECVMCMYLCCDLMGRRMRIMAKRKSRQAEDGHSYEATAQEMNMIREEFYKVAGENRLLDSEEFEAFYCAAFSERPPPSDLAMIRTSCDTNGDNMISWEEFWAVYIRKQGHKEEQFLGVLSNAEAEDAVLKGGMDKLKTEVETIMSSPEARLCDGLTRYDLEMLREKWDAVHTNPTTPYLTEPELREVCTLMCGIVSPTPDELWRFARQLNVRGQGVHMIGFREFTFPYAQRAQLHFARDIIRCMGKEVEARGLLDQFSPQLNRDEAVRLMRHVGVEKDISDLFLFKLSAPFEIVLARLYLR